MAYFQIVVDTPYCGTRQEEYVECETMDEAIAIAKNSCENNAESYEYLVTGWDDDYFDTEDERDEALEDYYENCDWCVNEVSAEEYFENIS